MSESVKEESGSMPEATGKMFTVWQVTLATFLGSPIAGCLLLAKNYRNLGNHSGAWKSVAAGIGATVMVFVLAFLLPEKFPTFAVPAAYTFGLQQAAKYLQGDLIEASGKKASWLFTIAIGLGSLIVVLAMFFVIVMLVINWLPE